MQQGEEKERHLIIEVLGTGGAGKTTLEPLLAEGLSTRLFAGGKRESVDGEDLPSSRVWTRRVATIGRQPALFMASARAIPSTWRNRLWFAMDLCRRQDNARIAATYGEGIVASGPLHALGQGSARFDTDLAEMVNRIRVADAYVLLQIPADVAALRLAGRRQVPLERVGDHAKWTERYSSVVTRAASLAGVPVIAVDAQQEPMAIASEAGQRLEQLRA